MGKEKKVLGIDSQGIQKTMTMKNFLGDGTGQIALNGMSGLIGMLTYFYTDKVGIAAAAAGTIMLIAKIIDAFTDLFMGYVVDRTKSKYGKARPWFLWMSIPFAISIVVLFLIPADAGNGVKFAYGLVSNVAATAIVYTAVAIPYGCFMAFVTKSTDERSKMGITRALFGYVVGMIIAIGLIPITNLLGGDQAAWIIFSVILAVVSLVSLILTFLSNKEQNTMYDVGGKEVEDKIPFRTSIKLLFQNEYWLMMLGVMLLVNVIYALSGATGVYYAKWVLKDENLVAIMGAVGLIPVFVGFPLTGFLTKRLGLAKACRVALLIGAAGTMVRVFFPYNLVITMIFGSFATFGTIPLMAVGGVMVNNTVEYGQWKHGKRIVGMANSATGFASKISGGLGAAMIGWILAAGDYNSELAAQSQSAINSILTVSIYIPGIMLVLIYIVLRFYDLDNKYPQIIKELEERNQRSNYTK